MPRHLEQPQQSGTPLRRPGQYVQAEPLFKRALATYERVLGTNHPDTARVRENYAGLLLEMKQKTKAVHLKPKAPRKQAKK